MICFFCLICLVVHIVPQGLRIILGPWSSTMCWWQIFFPNVFQSILCWCFVSIILPGISMLWCTRLLLCICNDDFIGFFIFIQTLMMGFVFALMHNMCYGKFALNYYVCQGKNPELDSIGNLQKFTSFQFLWSHKLQREKSLPWVYC